MLTLSIIKLFELSWNVGMVLSVAISSIYRVHILIVPHWDLSHQRIVINSAITWRGVICRFLDYLLFWTAMIFRWTDILWFGRLSHPHDIILLKLISIIFISRFRLTMYIIKAIGLLLCRWTCNRGLLKLSGGPLLILGRWLLTYSSILSTFALDAQWLIFELPHDRRLLLTLNDWSNLLITTRLLLRDILWRQLFRSQLD